MIKKYYVYAWFNEETEYIFYIGMGKGSRFAIKDYNSRSKLFIDYYNNHKCDVMFLEVQLTKEEAELISSLRKALNNPTDAFKALIYSDMKFVKYPKF